MTIQERYKVLGSMPVNHMNVAQMQCGCCLHPQLQVTVVGNQQIVSRTSDIRSMKLCREHKSQAKSQ